MIIDFRMRNRFLTFDFRLAVFSRLPVIGSGLFAGCRYAVSRIVPFTDFKFRLKSLRLIFDFNSTFAVSSSKTVWSFAVTDGCVCCSAFPLLNVSISASKFPFK
jgi:hypothetical protein